jgi:hypothetical protein
MSRPVPGLSGLPGRAWVRRRPGRLPNWPSSVPRPEAPARQERVWVARPQCWAGQDARLYCWAGQDARPARRATRQRMGPCRRISADGLRSLRRAWRPSQSGRQSSRSARGSKHPPARRSGRAWVRHGRIQPLAVHPVPAPSRSGALVGLQRHAAAGVAAGSARSAVRPRSGPAARVLHPVAQGVPPPGGPSGGPPGHRVPGTARGP